MLTIDGAYGEGGGQLVRTACAAAAVTGTPLRVTSIRARREPPGLAPQHLTAVSAVAALCGAETAGFALRSTEIVLRPGRPRGGDYRFDVGTAGSVTLVLQALLPVALAADAPVTLRLSGGTDVRAAPPLDYLRCVLLPLLARMGIAVTVSLVRRGYYPRGGGEIEVRVAPQRPQPLALAAPGALAEIGGRVHVANLPAHIGERLQQTAARALEDHPRVHIEREQLGPSAAIGPGGAIVLWARTGHTILGASAVAERGVPAERLAAGAAEALRAELDSGATLDVHAADQLLVYCALAGGASQFLVRDWTSHARTTAWLLERFFPLRVHATPYGALTRVTIESV